MPFQKGGPREGNWHLNAKVSIATAIDEVYKKDIDIWYERDIISWDGAYTFHVDIALDPYDVVVEVDGRKNHSSKRNKSKDRWKTEELEKVGLKVLRITVEEALGAPEQIIPQLDLITGRRKESRLC